MSKLGLNINVNVSGDKYVEWWMYPNQKKDELFNETRLLAARKQDLEKCICLENRSNEMVIWMRAVDKTTKKVFDLPDAKACISGADVERYLSDIKKLKEHGDRLEKAVLTPEKTQEMVYLIGDWRGKLGNEIVGLDDYLKGILGCLEKTEYRVIGIIGPPGIGKTTLLRRIKDRVGQGIENEGLVPPSYSSLSSSLSSSSSSLPPQSQPEAVPCSDNTHCNTANPFFSKVLFVPLGERLTPTTLGLIQEMVASQLDLADFSKEDRPEARSNKLLRALSNGTFLILLDNVWNEKTLECIGIPYPKEGSKFKIIFTTRISTVCSELDPQKTVKMEYLNNEQSRTLFIAAARSDSGGHKDIESIADEIVPKCGGLPLTLVTVARELKLLKLPEEWEAIKDVLSKDSLAVNNRMMENLFEVMMPSFYRLKDNEGSGFLFCALFGDRRDIERNELAKYWVGEELVTERNAAVFIINHLMQNYFLDKGSDEQHVKLQCLPSRMAAWIANKHTEHKFYVGAQISDGPIDVTSFQEARRASLIDTEIYNEPLKRDHPRCEYLLTLLMGLYDKRSEKQASYPPRGKRLGGVFRGNGSNYPFPDELFKGMPSIRVLDVTGHPITGLPASVLKLISLRFLNLSFTGIEMLPEDFKRLVNLRQLDLSHTKQLRNIPSKAISSLYNLRSFNAYHSKYDKYSSAGQVKLQDLDRLPIEEFGLSLRKKTEALESLANTTKLVNSTRYLHLFLIDSKPDNTKFEHLLTKFSNLKTQTESREI